MEVTWKYWTFKKDSGNVQPSQKLSRALLVCQEVCRGVLVAFLGGFSAFEKVSEALKRIEGGFEGVSEKIQRNPKLP